MATEKAKRTPVLNVTYSDKDQTVRVINPADESEVESLNVRELVGESVPVAFVLMCVRYIAGMLRDTEVAADKAKKDVADAIRAAVKTIKDGTMQFRERGGDAGLTTEQEFQIIAGVLVSLGKAKDEAEALVKVKQAYDDTKEVITPAKGTPAKGVEGQPGYVPASDDYREEKTSVTHPRYRKLKAVPAIAEALAKATKVDADAGLDAALGF